MSDEQTPMAVGAPGEGETKRKGWPKGKPRGARASSEASAPEPPKPVVQVTSRRSAALERRLAKGANPHASSIKVIPLREPHRWQLYIGNDYAGDDGLYRMVHEYGWSPLELGDLSCKPEEIGYRVNESGHLVRGPQGREVIFKMAKEDYAILQQRKTEKNLQGIGSATKTRTQVAEAAANAFGPEAGDYVHKHVTGTVTDTREALP
jgi:hypothetical protein